tara:strand:- start:490 stop:690 length:201 start_codon:yes stop_codon:yes gene_type:complete
MSIYKALAEGMALSLTNHGKYTFSNAYHGVRGGGQKFQYAGLSKRSPSHAQQKRDSKKAKNRGRKI